MLSAATFAMTEAYANRIWYSEKACPPNERAATAYARFYLDDVALRLYAAGEHLANAIIYMLEIPEQQLAPYEKTRTSKQSVLGHYMLKEQPAHDLTKTLSRLVNLSEWEQTRKYRDQWVHEQPPTLSGYGIVWRRKERGQIVEHEGKTEYLVTFGGGDEPELSLDGLFGFMGPALRAFADCVQKVQEFFTGLVQELQNQSGIPFRFV